MDNIVNNAKDWPIIGNAKALDFLIKSIKNGNTSQAYLFKGPAQTGKRLAADIFCQTIFCEMRETGFPCENCQSCRNYKRGMDLNRVILEKVEGKKNISIDAIREFLKELNTTSLLNDRIKIGIIDDASDLSEESMNALLKTMEEPPGKSVIILITSAPDKIPDTVVSRCQVVNFYNVAKNDIFEHLEKIGCPKKIADCLSSLAMGKPGKALNYYYNKEILQNYSEKLMDYIKTIEGGLTEKMQLAQKLFNIKGFQNKLDQGGKILNIWIVAARDTMLIKEKCDESMVNIAEKDEFIKLSENTARKDLINNLKKLVYHWKYFDGNANPQLTFENYFLTLN